MKTITCYKSEDNKIYETKIVAELADARLAITRIENCNGAIQDFIINHWRLILAILQKIDLPEVACETNNEKPNPQMLYYCQRCFKTLTEAVVYYDKDAIDPGLKHNCCGGDVVPNKHA